MMEIVYFFAGNCHMILRQRRISAYWGDIAKTEIWEVLI
jgi:hypothetical protein